MKRLGLGVLQERLPPASGRGAQASARSDAASRVARASPGRGQSCGEVIGFIESHWPLETKSVRQDITFCVSASAIACAGALTEVPFPAA
jgi:hypothetical protein